MGVDGDGRQVDLARALFHPQGVLVGRSEVFGHLDAVDQEAHRVDPVIVGGPDLDAQGAAGRHLGPVGGGEDRHGRRQVRIDGEGDRPVACRLAQVVDRHDRDLDAGGSAGGQRQEELVRSVGGGRAQHAVDVEVDPSDRHVVARFGGDSDRRALGGVSAGHRRQQANRRVVVGGDCHGHRVARALMAGEVDRRRLDHELGHPVGDQEGGLVGGRVVGRHGLAVDLEAHEVDPDVVGSLG